MSGAITLCSGSVVADIGGTNARFAYVGHGGDVLQGIQCFSCRDFGFLVDAIQAYLAYGYLQEVTQICLAVAGPVDRDPIDLPNSHWQISRQVLEAELGIPIKIINDFSAQVLSIGSMFSTELDWIGDVRPDPSSSGVIAVLGPGTGLGVSAMLASGEIVPSEAGHVSFAPQNPHELALLEQLWQRYERVSVERLLSGMGLANLYWANCRLVGQDNELSPQGVSEGAIAGDEVCLKAIRDFSAILGAVAGDVALMMGANSGVYLSGGILPLIKDLIDGDLLRQCFNYKGRFTEVCRRIPVAIVMGEHPGLRGCVQALRQPRDVN